MATILLVPMSRPTTSDLSGRLATLNVLIQFHSGTFICAGFGKTHRQSVGVAQVNKANRLLKFLQRCLRSQIALNAPVNLLTTQDQLHAVIQINRPGAALVEFYGHHLPPNAVKPAPQLLPAPEHFLAASLRAAQPGEPLHGLAAADLEHLAPVAEQSGFVPARHRPVLNHRYMQRIRPLPADLGTHDPRQWPDALHVSV